MQDFCDFLVCVEEIPDVRCRAQLQAYSQRKQRETTVVIFPRDNHSMSFVKADMPHKEAIFYTVILSYNHPISFNRLNVT